MSWVNSFQNAANEDADNLLQTERRWRHASIYKTADEPQVVSFGPFHKDSEKCKLMETHKDRALVQFLKRSGKPLRVYVASLNEVAGDLIIAYDSLCDLYWSEKKDEFLKLMILDGCFMLEILLIFTGRLQSYAPNDPIFSNRGIVYVMPDIKRDMLIISNQLPMLVLQKLLEIPLEAEAIEELGYKQEYINKMLADFYDFKYNTNKPIGNCSHVLEFCHRFWLSGSHIRGNAIPHVKKIIWTRRDTIPSVTELHESGIHIRKSGSTSLRDITFHKDIIFRAILKLPPITVDNETETMFLNLLTFERFYVGAGREVTNYLVFMNNIIRDTNDVSFLRSCDIIQNALGRDEVVANLFNSVSKDFRIDPVSGVYDVNVKLINYSMRPWVRWRASVKRTYFSSPWASISVIASMFLFVFTFAQTADTIFSYYHKP